ncbi:ABC transporter substrate-binding protein [Solirhodobacter olei]|uniref:ABC transporter substrate-binding protein n=1 Tax=Solirhodobacter olei TaxID=2493082 RepID=UPI000FDA7A13|nr:extracellular solute-binding protein [Solirhodobacter olei]
MKTAMKLALALLAGLTVGTGPALAASKTFKVWWYEPADGALGISWAAALKEFKQQHPDVNVEFELKTFNQINQAGSLILNSSEAPDVLEYNKGNGTAGLVASEGLLQSLDKPFHDRGWDKILSPSAVELGRYDQNGIFGSGPLYGISDYGEFVSVFYNADMLSKAGMTVPKTLPEFEADMDKFVAKGITPIAEAANDYPAQHLMYLLALSKADAKWVSDFEGLKGPLDTKPFVYAAQKLQDWVKKGYVSKDSTGMNANDMISQFTSGKSPFAITGTWLSTAFGNIKTFHASQFLFPGNRFAPGSTGNLWVVPKSAKHKDLAYDFIGITLSPKIQNLMGNSGGLPIAADPAKITNPVGKITTTLFNKLVAQKGLGFYPDWPVAGFYNVVLQGTQAVIGGSITPKQFGERLKQAYDAGLN